MGSQVHGRRLDRWLASLSLAPRARELERARRSADAELVHAESPPVRLAWRSAELTAGARRLRLAGELTRLVDGADGSRAELEAMRALAALVGDLAQPVSPRGVLMLERLLRDGAGPLLAGALAEVTRRLEAS